MSEEKSSSSQKLTHEAAHYMQIGRYQEAKQRLLELLSQNSTDGLLSYRIALCYFRLKEFAEAQEHCGQALANGHQKDYVYALLGDIHFGRKQDKEGEEAYLQALSINPRYAAVMAGYAYVLRKDGRLKKSEQMLKEAVALEPTNQIVLFYKFAIESMQRDTDAQRETLEQYLDTSASEPNKIRMMAQFAHRRRDWKTARDLYLQAFALNPQDDSLIVHVRHIDRLLHPAFIPVRIIRHIGFRVGWALIMLTGSLALMTGENQFTRDLGLFILVAGAVPVLYVVIVLVIIKVQTRLQKRR